MQKNYIIGLDLGINNVGWSIIDEETKQIEKCGVRLFSVSNAAEDRRLSRNVRRRMKRRENRIQEVLKLFESIGFPSHNTIQTDLLNKRVDGLKEQLTPQEIVNVVCYFMSHRGYIPFGDEERELVNLNGLYPCEYYMSLYQQTGKYRALEQVVNHSDLKKELKAMLDFQSSYYPDLNKIIGTDESGLMWIFSRKRKFWEGPGSINSYTPYGRFQNESDVKNYLEIKEVGKEKYLFEDLIGKCKLFLDEKCAPKANYYAEEFNLLNDFINIRVINPDKIKKIEYLEESKFKNEAIYKLTTLALDEIINYCIRFDGKSLSYKKVLKDVLGLDIADIAGYRITKDGKPEFSLMNSFRFIKKSFREMNIDDSWLMINSYENYNELIQVLAVAPGVVETSKMIETIHHCSAEELEVIKSISAKLKSDGNLKYHALSEKALKMAIKDMKSTCMNFMQVSKKFDYEKESRDFFIHNYGSGEGTLYMTTKYIDEIVASPQVKKTLRQSIRIINAIIREKKAYPSVIAIESTKDMNSKDKKAEIEKKQRINEMFRKQAIEVLESTYNQEKITPKAIERVMLFLELNSECPYCGKTININEVLNGTIEIEHILPISQSCDDSFDNKTLSCRTCNSNKKNQTPYQFLGKVRFDEFAERLKKFKISDKKRNNFVMVDDINKYKIRFFNRNLRDTAYATKELVGQIQLFNDYLKANLNDVEILTLSTPGQLTHKIRENLDLNKNRDDGKYHHCVDASIVGAIATTEIGKIIINSQNNDQFWILNKFENFNISDLLRNFKLPNYNEQIEKIKSDQDVYISMQVNKDPNRSLSNANISSFIKKDDDFYIIHQINNIYIPDLMKKSKEKLDVLFDENNSKFELLCQEQDPKLFAFLKNIYTIYQDGASNPFLNYCLEHYEIEEKEFDELNYGIKTPSKNNKGILVKKLRYMEAANDPFLLEKSNIKKKEKTYIGLDSVSIYCTRLYWDQDAKKIIFLPVYCPCVNLKTKEIDEKHSLYKFYYNKLLEGKNVAFIVDLYNGNYIEIIKPNGEKIYEYIKGYSKSNKSIQCKSGKYLSPKDTFILYDVDVLGNKKKRLTWPNN